MNVADYRILRNAAGCLRLEGRGWLAVAGRDRADFLQGLLSNDVAALSPGRGCYATCLTPQGRMIADMYVFADRDPLAAGRRRRRGGPAPGTVRRPGFHRGRAHREPDRGMGGRTGCTGRARARWRCPWPARTPAAWRSASIAPSASSRAPAWWPAPTIWGVEGYRVMSERPAAEALQRALAAAGAVAVEPAAAEAVRVESGRPRFPIDMDRDTIPLEAGIAERAISFDKGCYVGQEVIVRILHRGQGRVARRLVGLICERSSVPDATLPSRGAAIFSGGDEVGRVTSAVRSPAVEAVIALGYVRRELAEAEGARVDVAVDADRVPAVVTALPFVPADRRVG